MCLKAPELEPSVYKVVLLPPIPCATGSSIFGILHSYLFDNKYIKYILSKLSIFLISNKDDQRTQIHGTLPHK